MSKIVKELVEKVLEIEADEQIEFEDLETPDLYQIKEHLEFLTKEISEVIKAQEEEDNCETPEEFDELLKSRENSK